MIEVDLEQVGQFVDALGEELEGGLDGGGRGHVDAGEFQGVDGIFFAAGLEEGEIAGWVAGLEDLAGEGDGGAHAGGVLVDVERAVEMRDAQALEVELRVEGEVGPEIGDQ